MLPIIDELFNQPLITMDAIVENRGESPLEFPLDNKCFTANILYKAVVSDKNPVNQIRNISILQKLHLKIISKTTQKTSTTKSTLTALNFLNTYGT